MSATSASVALNGIADTAGCGAGILLHMPSVAGAPSSKAGGVLGARVTVTLYVWGVVVPSEAVTTMVIKFVLDVERHRCAALIGIPALRD